MKGNLNLNFRNKIQIKRFFIEREAIIKIKNMKQDKFLFKFRLMKMKMGRIDQPSLPLLSSKASLSLKREKQEIKERICETVDWVPYN